MTDLSFDSIFDDLLDSNEELRDFVTVLEAFLPEASLMLVGEDGVAQGGGKPLTLAPERRAELVAAAKNTEGFVAGTTDDGIRCQAISLKSPQGVLIIALDREANAGQCSVSLLRNSLDLALYSKERELLVADHDQAIRQIAILQEQHDKLVEDNYRQYRLNEEREKNYARTLESEIAKQTAELREANARLEEISRLKSEFLANMSHELRTPMNAIIGFSELLSETALSSEQTEYTRTIVLSAKSLLTLINDILDLAKIEAGKLELEHLPFDLAEVVDNVAAMFRIPAKEKGVRVTCAIDPLIPRRIIGDGNRLRQVLVNLTGNAMKFTAEGEISISIEPQGESDGRKLARFSVRDSGIGIPADRIDAIFEKFTQADGSTTRKYGGTGLGLAICLQLVEMMGGKLKVTSEPGKGSTFYFLIPLEEAQAESVPETKAREDSQGEAGKKGGRILLVEDNPVNQRLATILIKKEGYEVQVAGDGELALAALKAQAFDLVLMDVQMPNMDGMEATRQIRAIEADPVRREEYAGLRGRSAPLGIIGLTAHARKEDELACYGAGMNGFLTKPIVRARLGEILIEMMSRVA